MSENLLSQPVFFKKLYLQAS